jgi:hypothetical protein
MLLRRSSLICIKTIMNGNGNGHVKGSKGGRKSLNAFTAGDVINMVEKWKKSVIELDKMLYEDARKEFNLSSKQVLE